MLDKRLWDELFRASVGDRLALHVARPSGLHPVFGAWTWVAGDEPVSDLPIPVEDEPWQGGRLLRARAPLTVDAVVEGSLRLYERRDRLRAAGA